MDLSIVVPVFNEEDTIVTFFNEVPNYCDELNIDYEFLFVNDGSTDNTLPLLKQKSAEFATLKVINLSRNFGKESALTAGAEFAKGDAVIFMDIDLQDPPCLISPMVEKFQEGFDSVIAVRKERSEDSYGKRVSAKLFYSVFKKLSNVETIDNAGDFRLISRRVLEVVNRLPEKTRYMKGVLSWPGFSTATVSYDRPKRIEGTTKWDFAKLWKLALDGIFSFSTVPLKVWTYIGFFISFMSFLYMLQVVVKTMVLGVDVPGYASLISAVLFIGGLNLVGIGILGEYIGRIFIEVKARPTYVVESVIENPANEEIK